MLSLTGTFAGMGQRRVRALTDPTTGPRRASLDRADDHGRTRVPAAATDAAAAAAELQDLQIRRLVDLAKQGDAQAFGHLYDRFQPEILRYLIVRVRDRDVAEDIAQQVFLKGWQAIPRYEHRGTPFRAWLYRMAHNQMVDHFRTTRPTTDLEGVDIPEDSEADERLLTAETNELLQGALGRLSDDHRQVLVLRFLMEKSAREIGEIMGRKEVTVRGLQMRALQALRREIEEMGGMP